MRTRNNPGPETDDRGRLAATLNQSDSEATSTPERETAPSKTHFGDNCINLKKTCIATGASASAIIVSQTDDACTSCANSKSSVASTTTTSDTVKSNSTCLSYLTSDPSNDTQHCDTDGWTEVKPRSSKKKEQQARNNHGQENLSSTYTATKLLITPTQHFATAYDVIEVLEADHPTSNIV